MDLILSGFSQGLLWSLMAIGVYITFRILHIADLTVEGSYPLGAAVAAMALVNGVNPLIATLMATVAGALAGMISGILHTKLKIQALLAGIVTLTALYSINLKIMGKANISLLKKTTLVTMLQDWGLSKEISVLVIGLVFLIVVILVLTVFFKTQVGLALRASGDNNSMAEANGINVDFMKILGYMISNSLVALSGALLAQNNGYADLNSGVGTIVIALASIMIGEAILRNVSLPIRFTSVVFGSVVYRMIILSILTTPVIDADLVRLFSAILLALILSLPELKKKFN
ncbi:MULTISPECIES: ABC transporter permease [unclassified Gemella]|uniref:ABC transporter permease n=1 Tax=unclassified Gemella TaxID=2624949 RepID=UPI0010744DD0|nr:MULTISPECIES: ABC transporter permease [unclassified Gemella]MBF0710623.1 ABC transporter permease [Gemella sp. GL1.1]MBF0746398.1 ABC transporter permease [Gemella sp. 19428wG2_WT2a]NYS27967.1 ABC transporter permease [Gemella sp. GL1]TFU60181.1 ABC transporter permease [Gemella sp. WT2a]